jgi:cbb3-type cytochrome oxidase subunit 3
MNVLHDIFMGTVYAAGTILMLGVILAGLGLLIAAASKRK